ncbi:MAG: DUF4149 domain-containing protein [Nitrosomonadales bacterium]|nr:DUF4149 domain-containing protein [Nitrosomonadales bacterium]
MNKLTDSLALLAVTAWAGGLWGIGYVAVPILFRAQPDRVLAGHLAGQMLATIAYIGLGCACYLLAYYLGRAGRAAFKQAVFWIVLAMLLLAIAQLVLQPIMVELKTQALPAEVMKSALADRFRKLHGLASILYLVQSLLGAVLALKARQR